MLTSQTTTAMRIDAFTKWVHIHATAPADNYYTAEAATDFLAVWPDLNNVTDFQFVDALIRHMAATIDTTEQEGIEKLLGILTAHYYVPRGACRGPWSPARDATEGVPNSVLGRAYYRAR